MCRTIYCVLFRFDFDLNVLFMFNSIWPRSVFYNKTLLLASPQKCINSLHNCICHAYVHYIPNYRLNLATCTHLDTYIHIYMIQYCQKRKSILRKLRIISDCVHISLLMKNNWLWSLIFLKICLNNYELNKAFLAYIELSPFKPIFIALLYC